MDRSGNWAIGLARLRQSRFVAALAGVGALSAGEIILGLVSAVLLARSLGLEGLGIYTVAIAAVTLTGIPVELGLPGLTLREVAHGLGDTGRNHKAGILRFATGYVLGASAISITALTLFGGALPGVPAGDPILAWAAWLIPLGALGKIFGHALAGEQRMVAGFLPLRVLRPGFFAAALLIAVAVAPGWLTPLRAIGLHLVAATGALAYGYVQFHGQFGAILWRGPSIIAWREWAWATLRFGTAIGIHAAQPILLVLMIGGLAGAEGAGLFRIAQRAGGLIGIAGSVFYMAVGPRFARLNAEGSLAGLQRLSRYVAWASSSLTGAALLIFALIGEWLLAAVFGSGFTKAYWAVVILGLGSLALAAFGPATPLLNMTRHEGQAAVGLALALAVSVLGTWILAPTLGINGGALGSAVGTAAMAAFAWWQVRRLHGLNTSIAGPRPVA